MNNADLKLILFFFLIFLFQKSTAQKEIILTNPSFEDSPHPGHAPLGWYDCGDIFFPNETPPDVHPAEDPVQAFGVTKTAFHGATYLGMVVRENDSWESVAQRLRSPLQKGKCYTFSIYLSRSHNYVSSIRGSNKRVNFTTPIQLRIWAGGEYYCKKTQLLDESNFVENTEWKKYTFSFSPSDNFTYITLEAFYKTPTLVPPNGNILLDNASSIKLISCDDK